MPKAFEGGDYYELASRLTQRPDVMSKARYDELCAMIDPVMLSAKLSIADNVLHVKLSLPLLKADDQRKLSSVMNPIDLHWDGRGFNTK